MSIHIDLETRSELDLVKVGANRYARHPSTEVLCMAFAPLSGAPSLCIPDTDLLCPIAAEIYAGELIYGYNVSFERAIWRFVMMPRFRWPDIPDAQWRCSAAKGATHALPRALKHIAVAMSLAHTKDIEGHKIMLKLCRPRKPTKANPSRWSGTMPEFEKLYSYCLDDVLAERALSKRIIELNPTELKVWQLDQKMNDRGVMVDVDLVQAAIQVGHEHKELLKKEFTKLTNILIKKSVPQSRFLKWLNSNAIHTTNTQAGTVVDLLKDETLTPKMRRVLEIKQQLTKTSTAKYEKILIAVCKDRRLRDLLMYHGASTGRWAGKLVQPQNLPKNTLSDALGALEILKARCLPAFELAFPDVMTTLSKMIRLSFMATPGKLMYGGDYSAIEARVLFWLADDQRALEMYRQGADLYKDLATVIYHTTYDAVTFMQRDMGKRGILGCLEENTLICSDSGIKYIKDIKPEDKLWDGEQWVEHAGLLEVGLKSVIKIKSLNIELTLDHLILTPKGWQVAEEIAFCEDIKHLESIKGLAFGQLSEKNLKKAQNAISLLGALANLNRALESTNYGAEGLLHALNVLNLGMANLEEVQTGTLILSLVHAFEEGGLPHTLTSRNAVKIRETKTTKIMELEVLNYTSDRVEVSWNILLSYLIGRTGIEHSIELIIPKDIPRAISEWLTKKKTIKTRLANCYDLAHVGDHNRFQTPNAIVHNCGFGMGAQRFKENCKEVADLEIELTLAQKVIDIYRDKYKSVVHLWHIQENAAMKAVISGLQVQAGRVLWATHNDFLYCRLPSGRCLAYYKPKIEPVETPWGEKRPALTFMGINSATRTWERQSTYGGKLVENITQATARDILAEAMLRVEDAGYEMLLSIHDELLAERLKGQGSVKEFETLMLEPPQWATGLPIKSECWSGSRYLK